MLYLRIVDEKGNTLEPEQLTATGRGMVTADAEQLIEKLRDLQDAEETDDSE